MKYYSFLIGCFLGVQVVAQVNCEAYKYYGDSLKYKACQKAMQIKGLYQFSKEYQMALDESLRIDPTFEYAYWAKSVAYLKSGDMVTWKQLIDKAVDLNPKEYLGYRGWCRYQFFRDYAGAIEDIEKLVNLVNYDIGFSQNGTYHLHIARGLCYKGVGKKEKAIEILKKQIAQNEKEDFVGAYDYVHLGVLYLETKKYKQAMEMFKKQTAHNEIAENQYYMGLTFQVLQKPEQQKLCLEKAKQLYEEKKRMFDVYSDPMDKIYLENITNQLKKLGITKAGS